MWLGGFFVSINTSFRNARRRDKNFTMALNSMLWDQNLSLEAKALLTIFLSNKKDWQINMTEIIQRSKNGRDAHYRVLDELIEQGYIARAEIRDGKTGKFDEIVYIFSDDKEETASEIEEVKKFAEENDKTVDITYREKRKKRRKKKISKDKSPYPENQDTDFPDTVKPNLENQYINKTNLNKTNLNKTNINNTNSSSINRNEINGKVDSMMNQDEEEDIKLKIIKLYGSNISYFALADFLKENGISNCMILKTINECANQGLIYFKRANIIEQFKHVITRQAYGERIYDFAKYFVNGLKRLEDMSMANELMQQKKIEEYESFVSSQTENNQLKEILSYDWL